MNKNMQKEIDKASNIARAKNIQPVCLFDLDGVLCDYDKALERDMEKLRSPKEKPFKSFFRDKEPDYIKARMDLIRSRSEWWERLETLPNGMKIYKILLDWHFRVVILTQGPRVNAEAWKGKLLWCRSNLNPDTDIVITRDKSLVYGKILVDDFPPYIEGWLSHRPRGTVIMPDQPWNRKFKHKQVIRYCGTVMDDVKINRKIGNVLKEFKTDTYLEENK